MSPEKNCCKSCFEVFTSLLSLFRIKHYSWDSVNSLVSANLCFDIVTISHCVMFTRTLQRHTHQGMLGLQGKFLIRNTRHCYYNPVFNISLQCCEYRSPAYIRKLATALLRHQCRTPESIREAV